jgi:hypothetical protein
MKLVRPNAIPFSLWIATATVFAEPLQVHDTSPLHDTALQRKDAPAAPRPGWNIDSRGGGGSQRVLRIPKDDGITSSHLAGLRRKSATARELLDRIASLPAAILKRLNRQRSPIAESHYQWASQPVVARSQTDSCEVYFANALSD